MKRRQKRYESEQEILDAIDLEYERLKALREESAQLAGGYKKERLLKVEALVRRCEDVRLPKLKRTLAAFRTEPMPFLGRDKGVVTQ